MFSQNSVAPALLLAAWAAANSFVRAADARQTAALGRLYLEPNVITGTIYDEGDLKKVLFTFRRTATNSGQTVHVLREYFLPGGTLAAREKVAYHAAKFSSYHFEEFQNGQRGSAVVQPDSRNGDNIFFEFKHGTAKKSGSEKFETNVLVNDMVVPFILEHWNALMTGSTVKCRLITVARTETIGFKFTKESETTRQGKPVVLIRMEPTSLIIAQFIDALHFTLEKEGDHHVLQYSGRTAPGIRRNGRWEDLDALTVFDWK